MSLSSYLEDEMQTSYFNLSPLSIYKGKLTDEEIRIVSEYLINNLYFKVLNEDLYIILEDVIKVFKRINKYLIFNKYLLANIIFIMKKLYKNIDSFGCKYFEYNSIAFSIVVCYLIVQKFYFDESYDFKEYCNLFTLKEKVVSKEEFHILNTINFNFHITDIDVQLILSEIF
jgi:hypothetical protein